MKGKYLVCSWQSAASCTFQVTAQLHNFTLTDNYDANMAGGEGIVASKDKVHLYDEINMQILYISVR